MEKDKEKDIIDFGSVDVPKSWKEINLKTFQDIERYYADKDKQFNIIEVLHIVLNKDKDWVMSLPSEFLDIILEKLAFLQTQPEVKEPTNKIKIDGDEYVVNIMEKLKTGEYVSFDSVLKNDPHNYAAMLAILCRKPGEIYDSKFEAEVFEDRIKMFEKQPITNILPIVGFFLELWLTLGKHSAMYSQVEEAINHIQKQLKTSKNLGVFRRWYLTLRILKLKRSLKSISNTSQTSSHSLRSLYRKAKLMKKKTVIKRH